jgi:hypothetical protein
MLVCRVQKIPSPIRRFTLVAKIRRFRVTAIVMCTPCTRARICCIFSSDSAKCSEYTWKGVSYDGNFVEVDFDKLSEKREKLEVA